MMEPEYATETDAHPPVYVVSGGVGASGEQLVYTVLAQFPGSQVPVITIGNVRRVEQIHSIVAQAKITGGTIAHTLVETGIRQALIDQANDQGVVAIDLMGPMLTRLSEMLHKEPVEHPGLYRQLHKDYFTRVGAIEYTMNHDDGKEPSGWPEADIILVGVSRSGKTPLSLYLSVLGWKVANYPLVPGVMPPADLFKVDPRRVIGLKIEPGQLLLHRQQRQMRLGVSSDSEYIDPPAIYEEIEAALRLFRKSGFSIVDVTDKPIETCADEIIRRITRYYPTSYQNQIS